MILISSILALCWGNIPSAQAAPARHFHYQERISGENIELEIYTETPDQALTTAHEIWQHLRTQFGFLQTLNQRVSQAKHKTTALEIREGELLLRLQQFCLNSQRAYDPTDAPLRLLWGFDPLSFQYQIPTADTLKNALEHVNCELLDIQRVPLNLFVQDTALSISWENFRTGWLVSQAAELLRRSKHPAAKLSIRHVSYYHGAPPGAEAWKIPIMHPQKPQELFSYLYAHNQALAIVGHYQNYFMHNGRRFSDLIDPRSAYPVEGTLAVYALSHDALDAELLARAAAILDPEDIQDWIKSLSFSSQLTKLSERYGIFTPHHFTHVESVPSR